ncbi:MAG: diaminopimelate epimerase [Gammaproteobacteria bacterium]
MNNIPFVKYTVNGNNFVIVDETVQSLLTEAEKSAFAYRATNTCFGIGADNLLIVQACRAEVLAEINQARHYWDKQPDCGQADFVFRMFEPNGEEALCCGNGLICIANYLFQQYGIEATQIMTEIPFGKPNVVRIGSRSESSSWANMGYPRRTPQALIDRSALSAFSADIDTIGNLKITFRSHDLKPFTDETALSLNGYLVFTGEPHLVFLIDEQALIAGLGRTLFASLDNETGNHLEKRINFGSWLIDHIGGYLNKRYATIFPQGINVNFVRFNRITHEVEYRCFERGINRETLACGTGALAVAYIARRLGLVNDKYTAVVPHRCTWYEPAARLHIEEGDSGWIIHGNPTLLYTGAFRQSSSRGNVEADAPRQSLGQIRMAVA